MKQLFIGLLLVAAAAGAYYFLQAKKSDNLNFSDNEMLTGTWQIDSVYFPPKDSSRFIGRDSAFHKKQYVFQPNGKFLFVNPTQAKSDTSFYQWKGKNKLLINHSIKDSIGEVYSVSLLNQDSLVLQSADSAVFVLTKLKQVPMQ